MSADVVPARGSNVTLGGVGAIEELTSILIPLHRTRVTPGVAPVAIRDAGPEPMDDVIRKDLSVGDSRVNHFY